MRLIPAIDIARKLAAAVAALAMLAAASVAAEDVSLPPAPYNPPPEETKVKYDNWFYFVRGNEGYQSTVQTDQRRWFKTYAVFAREGDSVYTTFGSETWASALDGDARAALRSLWPLKTGNRAEFTVKETWADKLVTRDWRIALEVVKSEYVTIGEMRYPAYVVREHAVSAATTGGFVRGPALEYTDTRWYNPDAGVVLRSERKWIQAPVTSDESYAIERIDYPEGTTGHKLAGTKATGAVDPTLIAEVERLKRAIQDVQSAEPVGEVATAVPVADIDFGNYHALVIGIDDYKELPKLKTAVNDAKAVAEVLEKQYGFKVNLLLNPTRVGIIDALDEFREKLGAKDNLVIYYAGHGWLDRDADRGYWLPRDAQPKRRSHWVSTATITDTLKTLQAKHVMVVADSCYSGTLTRSANVGLRSGDYLRRMANKWTRVALVSGGLEPVADSGGGGHSPFAKAFIRALRENDSVLDGTELFSKMRRPVMVSAKQTPEYSDVRNAGHDGGDFLFVRSK